MIWVGTNFTIVKKIRHYKKIKVKYNNNKIYRININYHINNKINIEKYQQNNTMWTYNVKVIKYELGDKIKNVAIE